MPKNVINKNEKHLIQPDCTCQNFARMHTAQQYAGSGNKLLGAIFQTFGVHLNIDFIDSFKTMIEEYTYRILY